MASTTQFTETSLSDWSDPEFWRRICPILTVSEGPKRIVRQGSSPTPRTTCAAASNQDDNATSSGTSGKKRRTLLRDKGFATVDEPVADIALIDSLRDGIQLLQSLGFPATFVLLFDAAWDLAAQSRQILQASTLESNSFNFDLLAWCIESEGFSPHRDRQPDDVLGSFSNTGDAKFVTHWVALSEASPANSCLYMIPKPFDPGYETGDTDEQDPLQRALPNKEAFQQIQCFPRLPGQSILFTHRIAHWGSARDPDTHLPLRIAISFVCSDPSFEKPYIDPSYFNVAIEGESLRIQYPPFAMRLLLLCAQLLIYHQRFHFSKQILKSCYDCCKQHETELDESYRRKVFLEFVKAMKEAQSDEATPTLSSMKNGEKDCTSEGDDDDEEAMMEEMLNAEEQGYGEFEDDYEKFANDDSDESDEGDVKQAVSKRLLGDTSINGKRAKR